MATSLFTKPVAMVTFAPGDDINDGWAVIEQPTLIAKNGVTFIAGRHSAESADCVRGRRVLFPLDCVTSITEYESVAEVWEKPRPERKRRK